MSDACRKHLFSLGDIHYLNCSYMSPLSQAVEAAGIKGMRRKRVPTALKANDFFDDTNEIRRRFAQLINAPAPESIAALPSVSYGMATIARNTYGQSGQNMVLVEDEFPSDVYVWQQLCARRGMDLRFVAQPRGVEDRGKRWNAAVLSQIDAATALVCVGNVHWLDGTLFDLRAIGARAREFGAAFIVDGTQSLGAIPLDVQALQPDAVFASGYKWLMGPFSLSVGYYGPRYIGGVPIEENWLNRKHSEDFRNLIRYQPEYRAGAVRFDVGESSNFILAPMLKTALGQVLEWGVDNVQRHCRGLTAQIAGAARAAGLAVIDDAQRGPHFVGIRVPPELDIETLGRALAAARVAVSIRGQSIRVTTGIYNDQADVDAFVAVLTDFVARRSTQRAYSI